MTALAARPAAGLRREAPGLGGTGTLTRLALRRDRVMLAIWVYVFAGSIGSTGYSFRHLYTSVGERVTLAAQVRADPSVLALTGTVSGTGPGALVAWKTLVFAACAAALLGIITAVRHTRGDEEEGRLELVGSAAVGRQAPLAAALIVACGACLLLVPLIAVVQAVLGYPLAGSLALGAATGLTGCVFAAVGLICAQLTSSAAAARGMAAALVGLAFLIRAIGDAVPRLAWLSWASPVGWTEEMRVYDGPRWAVTALFAAATILAAALAVALAARRDLGAGLWAARPGRPRGARWLAGSLGLAWRLQRTALAGWTAGFALAGAVLGAAASGIGPMLNTSAQARQMFIRVGGHSGLVDAYVAAVAGTLGVAAAAYGVSAVLRLHAEETGQRAEPVLATPAGRWRWAGSHLLAAAAGVVVVLAAGGLGLGLGDGLTTGGLATTVPRMLGATLAQVPAAWLVAGVAAALFGLAPRVAVAAAWTVLGVAAVLTLVGPAVRLAQWVLDVSPFTHVPRLPGAAFSAVPLAWLAVIAAALAVAGLAGLRRRDLE
jgi:polyether ionophore transport system permease protein